MRITPPYDKPIRDLASLPLVHARVYQRAAATPTLSQVCEAFKLLLSRSGLLPRLTEIFLKS